MRRAVDEPRPRRHHGDHPRCRRARRVSTGRADTPRVVSPLPAARAADHGPRPAPRRRGARGGGPHRHRPARRGRRARDRGYRRSRRVRQDRRARGSGARTRVRDAPRGRRARASAGIDQLPARERRPSGRLVGPGMGARRRPRSELGGCDRRGATSRIRDHRSGHGRAADAARRASGSSSAASLRSAGDAGGVSGGTPTRSAGLSHPREPPMGDGLLRPGRDGAARGGLRGCTLPVDAARPGPGGGRAQGCTHRGVSDAGRPEPPPAALCPSRRALRAGGDHRRAALDVPHAPWPHPDARRHRDPPTPGRLRYRSARRRPGAVPVFACWRPRRAARAPARRHGGDDGRKSGTANAGRDRRPGRGGREKRPSPPRGRPVLHRPGNLRRGAASR